MNLDLTAQKVRLSWKDILWGYGNKYLGWADVAAYARKMTLSDHDERVFKLSLINKSNILELKPETFAKFPSLPTAETQTQVFGCFRPKYLLILPQYPLNLPWIPDNQASGLLFRRQRAHLACWPLSKGSNTSLSDG
ncbi:TPA: DUF2247 family protein, partial [Neisseria meningitidis]